MDYHHARLTIHDRELLARNALGGRLSRWEMGGVPLAAVAKYVGHSTVRMTMRYAHLMLGANIFANSVVNAFYANAGQREVQTDTRTDIGATSRHLHGL